MSNTKTVQLEKRIRHFESRTGRALGLANALSYVTEVAGNDCGDIVKSDYWLQVIEALSMQMALILEGKTDAPEPGERDDHGQ